MSLSAAWLALALGSSASTPAPETAAVAQNPSGLSAAWLALARGATALGAPLRPAAVFNSPAPLVARAPAPTPPAQAPSGLSAAGPSVAWMALARGNAAAVPPPSQPALELVSLPPRGGAGQKRVRELLPELSTALRVSPPSMAVSEALALARQDVKRTRSPTLSLADTGAAAKYALLSGPEKYAAIERSRIMAAVGSSKRLGRIDSYVEFMKTNFPFLQPLPVCLAGVTVWCSDYVILHGNMSLYIRNVVSDLRCATRALGQWGLDADDEVHLALCNKQLRRDFPSAPVPQPTLLLSELCMLYDYLESHDCLEARLVGVLIRAMVCMQARASELCDGALWNGDLVFHQFGVLIFSILNKCRKDTLEPMARVAPRLPNHLGRHDLAQPLHFYLHNDAGWGTSSFSPNTPVFRVPKQSASGAWFLSDTPLSSECARDLIIKYLRLAGVIPKDSLFHFTMHFGRAAGFNLLHNTMMLDRDLCAAAGGWVHQDIIGKHYHKSSPLELAVRIRLDLLSKASQLKWSLP